ncbi:hypothetical protein APR04_003782 [Promicromonospora umidemergens]|uniref:Recombination endonuclease VII n=1 Tax=Promicromonospora umidemergens TaxID=629679 RepID=A0ABP8XJE5_9MICO|nr:hypothetical protein [Promicromonospora umidemergens]
MSTRTRTTRRPACQSCRRGWDTVRYHGRGLCKVCHSAARWRASAGEPVQQKMPERCMSCGQRLRSQRAARVAGTVRYAGKGLCGSCWNRTAREERALLAYVLGTAS